MLVIATTFLCVRAAYAASAAETDTTQIPRSVQAQLEDLEDRFQITLDNECPGKLCTFIGCEVGRFQTLDDQANSSLPGLESTDEPVKSLQYKLKRAKCEFAVEPKLSAAAVESLKTRLLQKTKQSGMNLAIEARQLAPAEVAAELAANVGKAQTTGVATPAIPRELSPYTLAWLKVFPWVIGALCLVLGTLSLIWGFRRVGREAAIPNESNLIGKGVVSSAPPTSDAPTASTAMILMRIEQLREKMTANQGATADILREWLKKNESESLCLFIRHFGTAYFANVSEYGEHQAALSALKKNYETFSAQQKPEQVWNFLEGLERRLAGQEIQAVSRPLEEEFAFVRALSGAEFIEFTRLIQNGNDLKALLTFAPSSLRSVYFAQQDPVVAMQAVLEFTNSSPLSDAETRLTAFRLRTLFANCRGELKHIRTQQFRVIEDLLASLPSFERRRCLIELKKTQPALFQAVLHNTVMDEALLLFSSDALNEIFLSLAPSVAASYLATVPNSELVLAKLKKPLASSIRAKMSARSTSGAGATANAPGGEGRGPRNGMFGGELSAHSFIDDIELTFKAREEFNEVAQTIAQNSNMSIRSLNEQAMANL